MTNIITAPGEYSAPHGTATVEAVGKELAYGHFGQPYDVFTWTLNGRAILRGDDRKYDILGPYVRPRKRLVQFKYCTIDGRHVDVREIDPEAEKEARAILMEVRDWAKQWSHSKSGRVDRALSLLFPDEA